MPVLEWHLQPFDPRWHRPNGQTYPQYLETMRAYNFIPSEYAVWRAWQNHWMDHYAHVYGTT